VYRINFFQFFFSTGKLDNEQKNIQKKKRGTKPNFMPTDLFRNKLKTLPHTIGKLTNLVLLDLRNNLFTVEMLPPELGNLVSLRKILLSNNKLTTLPPEFRSLTSLNDLDVSNNQITDLPQEVGELESLSS